MPSTKIFHSHLIALLPFRESHSLSLAFVLMSRANARPGDTFSACLLRAQSTERSGQGRADRGLSSSGPVWNGW